MEPGRAMGKRNRYHSHRFPFWASRNSAASAAGARASSPASAPVRQEVASSSHASRMARPRLGR